jgi:hypothetical protein
MVTDDWKTIATDTTKVLEEKRYARHKFFLKKIEGMAGGFIDVDNDNDGLFGNMINGSDPGQVALKRARAAPFNNQSSACDDTDADGVLDLKNQASVCVQEMTKNEICYTCFDGSPVHVVLMTAAPSATTSGTYSVGCWNGTDFNTLVNPDSAVSGGEWLGGEKPECTSNDFGKHTIELGDVENEPVSGFASSAGDPHATWSLRGK